MRKVYCKPTTVSLAGRMPMVHIHYKGSAVAYFGVIVRAGSRNEAADQHGLAHFVEHTIFKGTNKRRAGHIINRMEAVGGELNAYTTKEETVVYSVFPTGNLSRAAELIADLVTNSRFPEKELEKEREVVADEIDSYLDSPSEAVYDDFEDMIFAGSPLGHNILGNAESLKTFGSDSCRSFILENYTANNMVAFYSGPQSSTAVAKLVDRYFSYIPDGGRLKAGSYPAAVKNFDAHREISSHQAHCVMGARIPGYLDNGRHATALVANMLGGPGMNSLLNIELREKRGLVYNVEASTSLFSDCGLFTVYFGCDPADRVRCSELVRHTVGRLDRIVTPKKLEAVKKQYLGQLIIATENRESSTIGAARSMLWRGSLVPPEETVDAIMALTATDLLEAAAPLATQMSSLTLSPD